jgi:hypothetical protein
VKHLLVNNSHPNFFAVEEEYSKLRNTPYEVLFLFDVVSHFGFKINENFIHELVDKRSLYKGLKDVELWNFWSSWALSENPGMGLVFLKESGWLELFPPLYATLASWQNPETHPEGSVFNHMVLSVNVASEIARREDMPEEDTFVLLFSALCHDLGKYISNDNHEKLGVSIAKTFLKTIGAPDNIIDKVLKLVEFHGSDYNFMGTRISIGDVNEGLVEKLEFVLRPATIPQLVLLNEVDINGRLDKNGKLVHYSYNMRVSEVYRKILSIYTNSINNKFSDKNIINMFNQGFVNRSNLRPGYPQTKFVESMNYLIKNGYIKKEESERVSGYYFSTLYQDALRYCATLDYRGKKVLTDYINEKNIDLDNLLLGGKSAIQKILNHSEI